MDSCDPRAGYMARIYMVFQLSSHVFLPHAYWSDWSSVFSLMSTADSKSMNILRSSRLDGKSSLRTPPGVWLIHPSPSKDRLGRWTAEGEGRGGGLFGTDVYVANIRIRRNPQPFCPCKKSWGTCEMLDEHYIHTRMGKTLTSANPCREAERFSTNVCPYLGPRIEQFWRNSGWAFYAFHI